MRKHGQLIEYSEISNMAADRLCRVVYNVLAENRDIVFNEEFYPFSGAVRAIREAADTVGIDRLMWGSDYPRTITAITYRMSYDFLFRSDLLNEQEIRAFLGLNAQQFYGFGQLSVPPYVKNMSE